jgi:hypothetical protein
LFSRSNQLVVSFNRQSAAFVCRLIQKGTVALVADRAAVFKGLGAETAKATLANPFGYRKSEQMVGPCRDGAADSLVVPALSRNP